MLIELVGHYVVQILDSCWWNGSLLRSGGDGDCFGHCCYQPQQEWEAYLEQVGGKP